MIPINNENVISKLNEFANNTVFHKKLFVESAFQLINSVAQKFGDSLIMNEQEVDIKEYLFNKIANRVRIFSSLRVAEKHNSYFSEYFKKDPHLNAVSYIINEEYAGIIFNENVLKNFILDIAKKYSQEEYEKVKANINLDKKRFNLPKESFETYDLNLKTQIIHELLHISEIQNVNTAEKSVIKFGFSTLGVFKPELRSIYNDFYDSINEYFNLSLMPSSDCYKSQNSVTEYRNPMQVYKINKSFMSVGLQEGIKKYCNITNYYLDNQGLPFIEDNLYTNVSNIIELLAHLVGEKELFVGMIDDSVKFVNAFNAEYKQCFNKYLDLVLTSSDSVMQLKSLGYDISKLEPFDMLACLVRDYLYKTTMISQELAQTILLECLTHSNIEKYNWEVTENRMQQIKDVLTLPKFKRENYEVSLVELAYDKLEDKAYSNEPDR
ncbi:MAG: hypothetical protein PHO33_02740 [Clostridia bacterium]|nr:hypothetical protein [Clostridia bacterium]